MFTRVPECIEWFPQEYHHERSSTHDVCHQAEAGAEATAAALRRLAAQHAAQQAERLQRQEGLQQRLEEAQATGMGWDFWRDGAGMVGIWVSLSLSFSLSLWNEYGWDE